jgi:hypothetical protein
MGRQPKQWPDSYEDWPANNSNAARDRDEAALNAADIRRLARQGLQKVAAQQPPPQDLIYLLAQIDGKTSDILRLLERNGAPTTPTR